MDRRAVARIVFGVTACAVLLGIVVQLAVSYRFVGGRFSGWAAVGNVFAYFTVQSNIIVGVTTAMLAIRPERTSTLFAALRLIGLVAISVTFAVFHSVLAGLQDLTGQAAFADALLHTVVPVLAVVGWLVFGPRGLATVRVAALALIFPLVWGAFTLLRGPAADFYPYPFIDVRSLGYGRVLVNIALVGVLFYGLAMAAAAVDHTLAGRRPELAPD